MSLIQMSVSAGVLIAAIAVIRALTIDRLPKKTFLILWGIALLRLLVPFSLESPISVYSLAIRARLTGRMAETPAAHFLPIALPQTEGGSAAMSVPAEAAFSRWFMVWLAGVLLCALFFLITYSRFRREFSGSLPVDNSFVAQWLEEHRLRRRMEIRQSDRVVSPLSYGILRPVILMPKRTDWMDAEKLCYILQHEYVHIRRFDTLTKILLTAALCVHWYNPLVWVMYVLLNRDLELSCDEEVVRSFGETTKSAYALTLINMEEWKSGIAPFANSFGKNSIEERIRAIMNTKKTTMVGLSLACFLVVGTASVFATSARINTVLPMEATTVFSPAEGLETTYREPSQQDLLLQYGAYGISFNTEGKMLFRGQVVRLFWDGVDVGDFGQATVYQYLEKSGTVDVHTMRTVIDNGDGSVDPFGALIGVEPYSQKEFDERNIGDFDTHSDPKTYAVSDSRGGASGETFSQRFKQYEVFEIRYEEPGEGGLGNVYYKNQLVRAFVDQDKEGGVFSFRSRDGGGIDVHTVYDENGRLAGVVKESIRP